MQQGSILPFLQKGRPSRPESSENSRPGQPYRQRHHYNSNSSGQHRGPNRRRNMDLKVVANETKAELPGILASIPGFDPAQSSLHNLKDLEPLDADDCPGFVLPAGDSDAGERGTRIRVFDMDTFDVALQLDPHYKVHIHLGIPEPVVSANTKHEDQDTVMEDAEAKSTEPEDEAIIEIKDETAVINLEDNTRAKGTSSKPSSDRDSDNGHNIKGKGKAVSSAATTKSTNESTSSTSRPTPTSKPVAVLNLASERSPGGGWHNGALAQEECLCYRSSLYRSLHRRDYPLPSLSVIHSPNVVLIRDAMSRGHGLLTPRVHPANLPVTSVISVAALRRPQLSDDRKTYRNMGQRSETKRKIRISLRVALTKGHTKIVLGALGCGVFANPPKEVAECFLEVLREKEFQGGWWEEVAFAVLDNVNKEHGGKDGDGNYGVFYRVLDGQVV